MLTIAIPCYKSNLDYLEQAIKSVEQQSMKCCELVIVDGNDVPDIHLQELAKRYLNIPVRYVYNSGDKSMAGNWNFAISLCNTELVTLLHSDDLLDAEYIRSMFYLANMNTSAAAYFCGAHIINKSSQRSWSFSDMIKLFIQPKGRIVTLYGDRGIIALLKGCFIFCPTICYRKSELENQSFNSQWKMVTDFQFYIDLLAKNKTIIGTQDKLYFYRRHNENQTSKLTYNCKRFAEEVAIYEQVIDRFNSSADVVSVASKKKIIKLHLIFLILKSLIFFRFNTAYRYFRFLIVSV